MTWSWDISCSQWVNKGHSNGVPQSFPEASLSFKSSRGQQTHPGTCTKANTLRVKSLFRRERFMASIYKSMPLLRNSYRPLVEIIITSSSNSVPNSAPATSRNLRRASLRLRANRAFDGTKSFSKPFIKTTSAGLSNNSAHSRFVTSLTVVKQSTW